MTDWLSNKVVYWDFLGFGGQVKKRNENELTENSQRSSGLLRSEGRSVLGHLLQEKSFLQNIHVQNDNVVFVQVFAIYKFTISKVIRAFISYYLSDDY